MIRFGPAGLGPVASAEKTLEEYSKLGIKACEIAFTYSIYIHSKEDAKRIGKSAEKLGISLSIHAPYFINLNSEEKSKREQSKKRILDCLEIGTILNAKKVVFHPGFYGKKSKEETYEQIKKEIIEIQEIRKQKNFSPELAPETTGKSNVFGSVDEIAQLVRDTKCSFCIDFAHILAREKDYKFHEVLTKLHKSSHLHIHFSGIEYGEKGEKKHIETSEKELHKLIENIPKNTDVTIINESPFPVEDSVTGIKIFNRLWVTISTLK